MKLYKVVEGVNGKDAFEIECTKAQNEGWEPVGGVAWQVFPLSGDYAGWAYLQAFTKEISDSAPSR